MKYRIIVMLAITLLSSALMAQTTQTEIPAESKDAIMVFSLKDGSEMTGKIHQETDSLYVVNLTTGFKVEIPKSAVLQAKEFKGRMVNDEIYQPDPNRSRYLWSVSAFPVGKKESYCSDFCLIFPSYNWGITDRISGQAGAMYFPGLSLDNIPIFAGVKISLPPLGPFITAGGIQYFTIPGLFEETDRFGMGFLFGTGTFGDQFDHLSVTLGWGFVQIDGESEIMDRPIIVLAGNKRISSNFALVTENWIIPDSNVDQVPISLALRFLGKQIAVDIGGIMSLSMLENDFTLPIPIINFAYHR